MPRKGRNIYKLPIFGFHVSFQGCNPFKKTANFPRVLWSLTSSTGQLQTGEAKPKESTTRSVSLAEPEVICRDGWEGGGWMEKCRIFCFMNFDPTFFVVNKKKQLLSKGKRQQCKKRNINQETSTKKKTQRQLTRDVFSRYLRWKNHENKSFS